MRFRDFLDEKNNFVSENNSSDLFIRDKKYLKDLLKRSWVNLADIEIPKWVKDLSYVFENSKRTDFSGIENWDVSHVTDFHNMFEGCKSFTGKEIEHWDVSKSFVMKSMFKGCEKFNADLSRWKVDNVVTMKEMFKDCKSFTGKGLEKWNTKRLSDMEQMFEGCKSFTGKSVEKWKLPNMVWYGGGGFKDAFKDSGVKNIPQNFIEKDEEMKNGDKEHTKRKIKEHQDAFKEKFGVDYSKAPKKAQELWDGYDRFAAYIDDGREYKKAMENNEWISNEIEKLLKNN